MSDYYVLRGRRVVPVDGPEAFERWDCGGNRRVGDDRVGDVRVSTVFLGRDHQFGYGPPLLFETMVFGGEHDDLQERYSTWDEAEAGHRRVCEMVGASDV